MLRQPSAWPDAQHEFHVSYDAVRTSLSETDGTGVLVGELEMNGTLCLLAPVGGAEVVAVPWRAWTGPPRTSTAAWLLTHASPLPSMTCRTR